MRLAALAAAAAAAAALASTLLAAAPSAAQAPDPIEVATTGVLFSFGEALADDFDETSRYPRPNVRSTGSTAGLRLFCAAQGRERPDIVLSARRMTSSEFGICLAGGVDAIVEAAIGFAPFDREGEGGPLYLYLNRDHVGGVYGLADFAQLLVSDPAIGRDGLLEGFGFAALADFQRLESVNAVIDGAVITLDDLDGPEIERASRTPAAPEVDLDELRRRLLGVWTVWSDGYEAGEAVFGQGGVMSYQEVDDDDVASGLWMLGEVDGELIMSITLSTGEPGQAAVITFSSPREFVTDDDVRFVRSGASAAPSPEPAVAAASPGPRYALIIANEDYPGSPTPLRYPARDAALMRNALTAAGFEVEVVADADAGEIERAIEALAERLREAGPEAAGFFYYAGHGAVGTSLQRRRNYMLPARAEIASETAVVQRGVRLETQIDALQSAGAGALFIVYDACRNEYSRGSRGFEPLAPRTGVLIAMSTADGSTTPDDGRYAAALAAELGVEGQDALLAFARASQRVAAERALDEMPSFTPALTGAFCFVCGEGP